MNTSEPVTEQFGHLTVITWTDAEGISINTFTAGTRNSALSATFLHTEREAAKAWYRTIRDSALAGTPVWLIEAEVAALIDAAQVVDAAERDMIDIINTTIDTAGAERQAATVDVSDLLTGDSYQAERRKAREQAARHNTRSRVHTKPLTPAELDLIRNHRDGVVTTRPGQPWTILRAIYRRIGGQPTYRPGTLIIASLTLTPAQLADAGINTAERAA